MNDLVSVIIPNYKRVVELQRTIESVLLQSYKNIEILVIDDNSPNFLEIKRTIERFNNSKIILIKHEKNKGGGATRNTGILNARGKYIAFLDSDDVWDDSKIEKQIKVAQNLTNVLIYCRSNVLTKKSNMILPKVKKEEDESISDYLFVNDGFIQTSSIFIQTEIAKECLFDETLARHQDYDFLLKVENKNIDFFMLDDILTTVYWNSGISFKSKGWTPQVSLDLLKIHKNSFTDKSFAIFYFTNIVSYTASYYSKTHALKYLAKESKILKLISYKSFFIFLIRLFFDWRYFFKRKKND